MSERYRDLSVGVGQNFLGDNGDCVTSLWHQIENALSTDISEEQVKLSIFETCAEEVWWIYWKRLLKMQLPARKTRGRTQKRCMDVAKKDIKSFGVTEEDARDMDMLTN